MTKISSVRWVRILSDSFEGYRLFDALVAGSISGQKKMDQLLKDL